jgi:hypothetical protein
MATMKRGTVDPLRGLALLSAPIVGPGFVVLACNDDPVGREDTARDATVERTEDGAGGRGEGDARLDSRVDSDADARADREGDGAVVLPDGRVYREECGVCPAERPICWVISTLEATEAECVPMPESCGDASTCDCAVNVFRRYTDCSWPEQDYCRDGGDGGDGAPLEIARICPGKGPIYCQGTVEGNLRMLCNPP